MDRVPLTAVLVSLLVQGCGDGGPAPVDDGLFCTGVERCEASGRCVVEPACDAAEECVEETETCRPAGCEVPDADGDGVASRGCGGGDCDDEDPRRSSAATEICDPEGVDQDCDPATYGARDLDREGLDDGRCRNVIDDVVVSAGEDCDDTRRAVQPGSPEVCNGLDDDCDGATDEGVSVEGFADLDVDGHGDLAAPRRACPGTRRFALEPDDCDDGDRLVHGSMPELCDTADNDWDTRVDEASVEVAWYPDADGDGWGGAGASTRSCAPVPGASFYPTDCDGADPTRSPSADERCNGPDDDCNVLADFVLGVNDREDDEDGFADVACGAEIAEPDCDDVDPDTSPRAGERCGNGYDDDCDGTVDDGCASTLDGGMPMDAGSADAGTCDADLATDPESCGACRPRCRARPHADAICEDGLCGIACAADPEDCNASRSTAARRGSSMIRATAAAVGCAASRTRHASGACACAATSGARAPRVRSIRPPTWCSIPVSTSSRPSTSVRASPCAWAARACSTSARPAT